MIDFPHAWVVRPARALMRNLRLIGCGNRYVPGGNVDGGRTSRFAGNPLTSDLKRYERNDALVAHDPTLGIGGPTVAWLDAALDTIAAFRAGAYAEQIGQPTLMLGSADTIVSARQQSRDLPRGFPQLASPDRGSPARNLQEQDGYMGSCGRLDALCRARRFRLASPYSTCGRPAAGWYPDRPRGRHGDAVTPAVGGLHSDFATVWAAVDRILVPSVRWAVRRRANRAIEELNTRLASHPAVRHQRKVLIDRLVFDPEVLHAADEYAGKMACRAKS
jgi:hypothetical protein